MGREQGRSWERVVEMVHCVGERSQGGSICKAPFSLLSVSCGGGKTTVPSESMGLKEAWLQLRWEKAGCG